MTDPDRRDPVPTDRRPIGFWLETILPLLHERTAAAFGSSGIGRRQWRVLTTLNRAPASMNGIRAALPDSGPDALARSGTTDPLTTDVDDLVERGWVGRGGDSFALTLEGQAEHDAILERISATRSVVTEGIDAEDFATTMATLEHIARNLGADLTPPGTTPHPRRPR